VKSIQANAFMSCGNLSELIISNKDAKIPKNAVAGCSKLTIIAPEGSQAEEVANKNYIDFKKL
jgi:hypothetical protein